MGWDITGKTWSWGRRVRWYFREIEFRSCFVDMWVGTGDIEVVKGCAKIRLERKITLDWARKQRLRRMWGFFFLED
jgi:hypothetical protein